jgi:putative FmdB family regulatory protein
MPLFDFQCRACGREFEALVRPGHVTACPACAGQDLEQKPSTFAVSSSERRSAIARKTTEKAAAKGRLENTSKAAAEAHHRDEDH